MIWVRQTRSCSLVNGSGGHLLFVAGLGQTLLYKKMGRLYLVQKIFGLIFNRIYHLGEKHGQVPAAILFHRNKPDKRDPLPEPLSWKNM